MGVHDLRSGATSLHIDTSQGVPAVSYWGAATEPAAPLVAVGRRSAPEAPLTLVPEHGSGFPGHPGLLGRRADGTAWAPRFALVDETGADGRVATTAADHVAGLELRSELEATAGGGHRIRIAVTNRGDSDYSLDELSASVAVPAHTAELLLLHGRWGRELHPQRQPLLTGATVVENRRGRTSHEDPPLLWAGTAGFGEQHGEVWGAHLAWSGNHRLAAERLADGRCRFQLGELLHPGEIVLAPGESYATPWVILAAGDAGLSPASRAFHGYVRSLAAHATSPRPVNLNVWEAVYFDHDNSRLLDLAARAAEVGVERFVLDDGWFGSRRDDGSGLGDWWVSPDAHPDGLGPLIARVRELGMQFGIWVEPEMVNPDSDLYRAHPEWALVTRGYEAPLRRHQLVLDLARDDAFAHICGQLDALLSDHDIAYVKWDMNRDHIGGSGADGRAGTHRQTLATYRLLDELRRRHPAVEFESCSSGGARIDHGILERAERVWASDCNDALERQTIQRYATLFVPPEVLGTHVGPTTAHSTGRTHTLAFRAVTALFGHFGIEWNLLEATDDDRDQLAGWIALYKQHRALLHGGDVVRIDAEPDANAFAHGVLGAARDEALVAYVQLGTPASLSPSRLRIPELGAERRYVARLVEQPGVPAGTVQRALPIVDGIELTGHQLDRLGVQLPMLLPESSHLVHVVAVA